jgi:hypothetical protein
MKTFLPLCAAIVAVVAACNNVGSCPSSITPGASCSGDNLECPYTIQSSSATCSSIAVNGAVATSCTCLSGIWQCPSCADDGGGDDGAGEGGDDATSEGGGDGTVQEGGDATLDRGGEASVEAGPDGGVETSTEASTDGGAEATDAASD